MRLRFRILIYVIIFVFGLAWGFYLALYLQNQTILLVGIAILFVFLTWLGSGAELVGLLRDLYKEAHEKPQLSIEYDEGKRIYCPELDTRKHIKVKVTNSGGIAKNCEAELRVLNWSRSSITPSEEPKFLTWCSQPSNLSTEKNIRARSGEEFLHVVFSDSRPETQSKEDGIYAFVSTIDNLNPKIPHRGEYGFGIGNFEIEIIVTSEDGFSVKDNFELHVDKDFRKLSMEKIP